MDNHSETPADESKLAGFDSTLSVLAREQRIAADARHIVGDLWAESHWLEPGDELLRSVHDYLALRSDIAHEFFMVAAGAR